MHSVEIVLGLVLLGTAVAALAARYSAPAPSLLVLVGLAVALLPGVPEVELAPDVVSLVVLPPLLYAAGHDLSIRDLRTVAAPVALLAVGLVLATAAAVAAVAATLLDVPIAVGFVLGAILASTDPVAVTALARTLRLPPRLQTLVTAESLFNDATSLVLFRVALGVVAVGAGVPWGRAGLQVLQLAVGGLVVGLLVALAAVQVRRRTEDTVLETVLSLLTPYAAYVAAEAVGASGVTAVVVTGVTVGALGSRLSSASTRLHLSAVDGTVVFLLESVVFSLIGLQLPALVRDLEIPVLSWLLPALAVTATVIAMRALWVFPLAAVLQRRADTGQSWRPPAVITWAGTRGVVPLTAALSVPLTVTGGEPFPQRDLLLVLAISVCVLTLVGQGLTLRPLTLRSGVAEGPEREQRERALGEHALVQAALDRARELADSEAAAPVLVARLVDELSARQDGAVLRLAELDSRRPDGAPDPASEGAFDSGAEAGRHVGSAHGGGRRDADDARMLRRDVLHAEAVRLDQLLADGDVGEAVWRQLQRDIDLREAALGIREL